MDTQNEAPTDILGRLPEFACSHWTGYGIESELCQNYLHAISALRAMLNDPYWREQRELVKKGIGTETATGKLAIHAESVIRKSEEK